MTERFGCKEIDRGKRTEISRGRVKRLDKKRASDAERGSKTQEKESVGEIEREMKGRHI